MTLNIPFILLAWFFLGPPETDRTGSVPLNELQKRYNLTVQVEAVSGRRVLSSPRLQVAVTPGLNAAVINGQFHRLSGEVMVRNKEVVVPSEVLGLIEASISRPSGPGEASAHGLRQRPFRVVIDPGHGGAHTGGEGRRGLMEKDVNLDVAMRLKDLLKESGFDVVMTRTTDRHLSENVREDLQKRVDVVNRENPDLFISIHSNWHRNSSARGFEIYTSRDQDRPSQRDKNREFTVEELRKTLGAEPPTDSATRSALNSILMDEYRKETRDLAHDLRAVFASSLDTEDRGVKEAGYYVIKWVRCPAILVEMEFISNPKGERELGNPQHRQKIASLLSRVIVNFSNKRDPGPGTLR